MGDAWTIPFELKTHSTLGMSSKDTPNVVANTVIATVLKSK